MPSRPAVPDRPGRWPLRWRWTVLLALLAVIFVGLRGIAAVAPQPDDSAIFTDQVVVVGVPGRYQLTEVDQAVLGSDLANAQVGAMSIRARYVGDCAASGWATIGAGRRTSVGGGCDPQVQDRQVAGWPKQLAAAAARNGDAHPGTLAQAVPTCVAAVGPGAALAAARPDGSLAHFETAQQFLARGAKPPCPITLIDPGGSSAAIIGKLAAQEDLTLIVTGIGPAEGSNDPGLQVIYRLGTTLPGWLTSASTRRNGVVTLADLTRTLIDFGQRDGPARAAAVDGAPFQVEPDRLTLAAVADHLEAVAALSDVAPIGYLALGAGWSVLLGLLVICLRRGRYTAPRIILTFGTVMGAAMMLTGAVRWYESSSPAVFLVVLVALLSVILTAAALLLARVAQIPLAVAGATLTVAALTVDAALGGAMQPGSLLNSRPIFGGRWYGFGNVTFSAYAAAGLILAGFLADRFRRAGRPYAAGVAAGLVGFGIILCEGWPSMGSDFGGVLSLTPGVLWLLLTLSGVRITWARLLAVGAAAVAAIAAISWLDWLRGPDSRSHLGNFAQRILDGDAGDVVIRKAVASAETILSPLGIGSLIVGIAFWVVIFKRLLPVLVRDFGTLRTVAVAALATAILGTLLNDGGISVWITVTMAFSVSVASLAIDRALPERRPAEADRRER